MKRKSGALSKKKGKSKPKVQSKPAAEAVSTFNRIRHPLKRAFLTAFASNGTLTQSAIAAKCDRTSHYIWEKQDPEYAEAFQQARRMFADMIEAQAIRQALVGIVKKKFYKGRPVMDPVTKEQYGEREISERMLLYQLEKRCRDIDQPGYSAHHRPHLQPTPASKTPDQEKLEAIAFFREVANDTSQPMNVRLNARESLLKLMGVMKEGPALSVEELAMKLAEFNRAVEEQCNLPPQD